MLDLKGSFITLDFQNGIHVNFFNNTKFWNIKIDEICKVFFDHFHNTILNFNHTLNQTQQTEMNVPIRISYHLINMAVKLKLLSNQKPERIHFEKQEDSDN